MRVRSRFKEKRLLILGKIMRKMKLNQKALRRTASGTPVDNRIFKPAALAKAIAGVFVASFAGISVAVETVEIGGLLFEYNQYANSFVLKSDLNKEPLGTWNFSTSAAFANGSYRDISLEGAHWNSIAGGDGAQSQFNYDTFQTLSIKGKGVFTSFAINNAYVELLNKGTIAVEGIRRGEAIGSVANNAKVNIENAGSFYVKSGSGVGVRTFFGNFGNGRVNNLYGASMEFGGGPGDSVEYFALLAGDNSLQNAGTITFRGSSGGGNGAGVGVFAADSMSSIINAHGGTINVIGSSQEFSNGIRSFAQGYGKLTIDNSGTFNFVGFTNGGFAVGDATYGNATTTFTNRSDGVININNKGFKFTVSGAGGTFTLINQGTINAEAETFFLKDEKIEIIETPVDIIIFTPSQGQTKTVNLDSFATSETNHHLDWKFDEKWANCLNWQSGGVLNITDIVAGTKEAELYKQAFEKQFGVGTGTRLNFIGTQSYPTDADSRITKPQFTIVHVNELISKGELQNGSIVTSEALHHKGQFTIGNTGDMTQDTGFMGILGSSGITVKDGKTLTLMGAQASMAMAVGADDRAASYVMTDAPTTLQNGTLNLGHKALSATEGTLADVTFDRMSTVNVENGIYTLASLKGEGTLNLNAGARTDVTGELSATQVTNAGTLTVAGQTVLGAAPEGASTYAKPKAQTFVNENGATANLTGGLVVNDFATVKNKTGATINAGAVTVDTFGVINNYEGATLAYASVDADGIVRNLGTLNVTGTYAIGDEGETTFAGDTKVGTLSIGRTAKTMLMARDGQEAVLHNTGKTYADELDLVSGQVMVEKDSILAGKSLKNGAVGSDIIVSAGGTFGFSHDKSSLENALKNYTGSKADKAILALNTDLHFGQGGSLTVGSVDEAKGTVNLGSDALLLLGTTQLHGEALLNGESAQHLHVEDGAVIGMTDDLLWGNHYLMKGFDDASTAEILKVGILDKDGKALGTKKNDKGIFVTVGSDNILEKDKSYRMVNQMNWLLDGRQDLTSVHGDVAFLTNALVDKNGALATNRMEALAADSSALAETQRMGAQVQTTMLDHASSARKGYGTFWVDGIYSKTDSGDFTRSTGAYGYEADTTGFAFGADLPMGDDTWRLGAAFSAQRGDLDGSYGLSSDIEGYGFSVYGGKTFSTGLNLSGALTYMTANHEVDAYNLGKVKADIDADMWVLGARMSMPFGQNRVWMTPYLGVDVMKLTQDGFTSSWSGMDAFRYSDVDATIVRTPVGVRAGTFMPLELFGRSGTVNWDADISFIPQFGDKDADFKVSGISNGHSDGMSAEFVNDWLSQAKFGMSYQGAAGSFGLYYAVEKGDVRDWSNSVMAKASLFF